jgi:alpha-tubulin suppressor-like RCC1 family protein
VLRPDGSVWDIDASETVISGVRSIAGINEGNKSYAIKENGELVGWGSINLLGTGDVDMTGKSQKTPVHIMDGVAQIAAGQFHRMAVKTNGELWGWGDTACGQLGHGWGEGGGGDYWDYDAGIDSPSPIYVMDNVASVAVGQYQTSAVKTNGELWTWGVLPTREPGSSLVRETPPFDEHYNTLGETPYKMMDGVASVSVGYGHHAAVKTNGELWAWGANEAGQLGDGTTENRYYRPAKAVKVMDGVQSGSAGGAHTLAIKTDGSLWAWGSNKWGQLGDGTTDNRLAPVNIMDNVAEACTSRNTSFALTKDGVLWAWGRNYRNNGMHQEYIFGIETAAETNTKPVRVIDCVMVGGASAPVSAAQSQITVTLDGKPIAFDQPPIIENGRTLVPMRAIFEALGATVYWNGDTRTVTATRGDTTIVLTVGSAAALVNGKRTELDVPAKLVNSRTLVPARFVAESLDCKVDWNNDTRTVVITR